jgi:hypothetical protein
MITSLDPRNGPERESADPLRHAGTRPTPGGGACGVASVRAQSDGKGHEVERQVGNGVVVWRVLLLVGAILNCIGLLAGSPPAPAIGTPIGAVGVAGLIAARRKAS